MLGWPNCEAGVRDQCQHSQSREGWGYVGVLIVPRSGDAVGGLPWRPAEGAVLAAIARCHACGQVDVCLEYLRHA
jgi:hypothetical protein